MIAVLDREDDLDSIVAGLVRIGFPAVSPLVLGEVGRRTRIPGAVAALSKWGRFPHRTSRTSWSRKERVRTISGLAGHHQHRGTHQIRLLRTTPVEDPRAILRVLLLR